MEAFGSDLASVVVAAIGALATVLAAWLPARIGAIERRLEDVERCLAAKDQQK
jgi:hypothetical protein